ncbi:MAG TPA: DNA-directed RNA polymerase subunit omega [Candidatus Acidoferrales bacterium]|nr:DNA-directed RNA polymerase subunit omega [Candidatus Acidoferrales bacterium]
MGLKPIELSQLDVVTGNAYEAIAVASQRARQISDERKVEFTQRLEGIKQVQESLEEDEKVNPEQVELSKEFDKCSKPTEQALDELVHGKIAYRYKSSE